MRPLKKYVLCFLSGIVFTKLMAYVGYQFLLHAAEKCIDDFPGIPGFLVPVCMQAEHPVLVMIGKLLNLTY